jgi:competence protein ComEC
VAYYFGTVSLVGLVTNLVTLWLVSYIFYGILLVCAVSLAFWKGAALLASCVGLLIQIILGISKALAKLPFAAVYTQSIYIVLWLVFVYALLAAYLLLRKKPALIFSCCIVLGLFLAMTFSWVEPLLDGCRATALDVGQGQAILLQSKGKTFLVDCGGSDSEETADTTAEFLMCQGIFRLDGIILTHYDTDHAGGLPYLLTRISADNLFLPVANDTDRDMQTAILSSGQYNTTLVAEDLILTFDDCSISLFSGNSALSSNERSICVLFQSQKCDILITGDRTGMGELALMQRADLPELELLVAGHHGAAESTSEWLLEKTKPKNVFVSVGEDNRYGHPDEELLERLESFGCQVYRTDRNGTLIFRGE